jgi:SAM-dependent methyltransferase
VDGIWHCLLPQASVRYAQFIQEYEAIRLAEGRSSPDPAYYRALPWQDLSGRMTAGWATRAQTFTLLLNWLKTEPHLKTGCDLGAGNGWLSNQLSQRGYQMTAVDLTINRYDGLGAHTFYETRFCPIQAEFDQLPLADKQFDFVLFNASFHYATQYEKTLLATRRLLKANGFMVVMDTPIYRQKSSGEQMVAERQQQFLAQFGLASNSLPSENFLTYQRVSQLDQHWPRPAAWLWPVPLWRRLIRQGKVWLSGRREAAQFPLLIWQQQES